MEKKKEGTEGFYLDEKGRKSDSALFADDDNFTWPEDYQIEAAQSMRDRGYDDSQIKSTYPLGWAALNK